MMSSIILMLHYLSKLIRIVAVGEIERERHRQMLHILKVHTL